MGGFDPQDIAVVIAGHGDRGGEAPNRTIQAHADAVRLSKTFRCVAAGLLKGEPSLEAAVQDALGCGARAVVVYPFFMADGYFVKKVLRERIAAVQGEALVKYIAPLGLDPRLPGMMLEAARRSAEENLIPPSSARLLVAGHGSKFGPASAEATRLAADRIAMADVFERVETAFLEEEPFVAAQLAASAQPTVVSGFFCSGGMHAAEDVPAAISETGANAIYAGPIGASAQIPRLIKTAVLDQLRGDANPVQINSP